ncbi:MAG TPA: alpha/beta hydrolase [Aliiroseovarius sp.]|nr:alpha/beta hydrolase [Aliiroseovarius sp.]
MSLRLGLFKLSLRFAVKRRLARMRDPQEARRIFSALARYLFRAPPFSLFLPGTLPPDTSGLWISCRPSRLPVRRRIILYVHGGGFITGSPQTHGAMLARLSRLTGMEVFAPDYRLAPEHPFPAGLDDVRDAFEALLGRGYLPDEILLGGDSAGGTLVFALLAQLCREGRAPRAVFTFSPLTDLTFASPSFTQNALTDPLFPPEGKEYLRDLYLAGHPPDDPRASPLHAKFTPPLPPVFLQYSESEILRDDSRRMAEVLRNSGGTVIEDAWPDTPHVWVLADGWVPEAREALKRVAAFIASV